MLLVCTLALLLRVAAAALQFATGPLRAAGRRSVEFCLGFFCTSTFNRISMLIFELQASNAQTKSHKN